MQHHITTQIHDATLEGLYQERSSYVSRVEALLDAGAEQEADAYMANINRVNAAISSLAHQYRPTHWN